MISLIKSTCLFLYQKSSTIMGNFLFFISNINEINLNTNNANLMGYIQNYRKLLEIINKNDKNELELFISTTCKNSEFIDLCSKLNLYDSSKRSILNYIASNSDSCELLDVLLRNANKKNEILRKYGVEALMCAISCANFEGVRLLIDFGANINQQSRYGWSTIHEAANVGNVEILQYLLDNGGNVNIKDNECKTPLHVACDNCNLEIVKLLKANGCDLELIDKCGWSALHISCGHNDLETVKYLIENGANIDASDTNGHKPLNWAVTFKSIEVIQFLVNIRNKLQLNRKDYSNNTTENE